jgi:hypothetical protein
MDIGKPNKTIIIEPLEQPIPAEEPATPQRPAPVPEREPELVPA